MTNAVSGLEMSMHHSGINSAPTAAHGWTDWNGQEDGDNGEGTI